MTDDETFALIRDRLFTAVIGDVMDAAGLTQQFLPPEIRALQPDTVLVGRAMPVLEADIPLPGGSGKGEEFGLLFRALDDLKRGEVYICTGSSPLYALWGGLMSTRAAALGAVGAVVDGYHRDTREIVALASRSSRPAPTPRTSACVARSPISAAPSPSRTVPTSSRAT